MPCLWWLAGGKCLVCVRKGGFMVGLLYARTLVPMLYLKLWNYIDRPSVPSCPTRRVRPVVSVPSCPSRRVRPVVAVVVLCSSRRPSRRRRPSCCRRPCSVRPTRRFPSSPSSSSVRPSVPWSVLSSAPSSSSVLCVSKTFKFHASH